MLACWHSCWQNNQVAGLEIFLDFRSGTEIDDDGMARDSRQGKIIKREDDLGNINPFLLLD